MSVAVALESILVVTKRTALEELEARFNSRAQARFYIEHAGLSFAEYEAAHDAYHRAVDGLRRALPRGVKSQLVERGFLPSFKFSGHDLVVVVGPDGLVINAAKYLTHEPILALNPDPERVDGILVPFSMAEARARIDAAFEGRARIKRLSMAQASLNDGQTLYAANDFFIGARTHVSARYTLSVGERTERQSSSGVIVSTGAGSTGWLSSVLNGAAAVAHQPPKPLRLPWDSDELVYAVREPFASKTSGAQLAFGRVRRGETLVLESSMPENGVLFSDGIEADFLAFNSGAVATVRLADKKAALIAR